MLLLATILTSSVTWFLLSCTTQPNFDKTGPTPSNTRHPRACRSHDSPRWCCRLLWYCLQITRVRRREYAPGGFKFVRDSSKHTSKTHLATAAAGSFTATAHELNKCPRPELVYVPSLIGSPSTVSFPIKMAISLHISPLIHWMIKWPSFKILASSLPKQLNSSFSKLGA